MRAITSLNNLFRRHLGSIGPVSPGRAMLTGAGTVSLLKWGVPAATQYLRGMPVNLTTTWIVAGSVLTVVAVEGVFYALGNDKDVKLRAACESLQTWADELTAEDVAQLAKLLDKDEAVVKGLVTSLARLEIVEEKKAAAA